MSLQSAPLKAVFTGSACANCFKLDQACSSLLKCGGCKHAWYCSKECQKEQWAQHKKICKAVGALAMLITKERLKTPLKSQQDFNMSAAKCAMALATMLQRPLNQLESLLFQGEAHCPVCFRTRDMLPEGVTLRNCSKCSWGWACSEHWEQLKGQHGPCCAKYAMLNKVELLVHQHVKENEALPSWCSEDVRKVAQQLPAGGWQEYKKWRPVPDFKDEYLAAVSTYMSQPLTTMLGLQHHYPWQQLTAMDSITVHVVGASQQDGPMQAGMVWEELMHLLPKVKKLHVVFVGPDMRQAFLGPIRSEPLPVGVCMECETARRQRLYSIEASPYHEYYRKRHYCKPTIVVAFNSGCGMEINLRKQQQEQQEQQQQDAGQQQDTGTSGPPPPAEPSSWQPTLDLLVAQGLPCIFTCYNAADARDDVKAVQQAGGAITQEMQLNPYSGLVEFPDVDDPHQFYRSSMYTFCFKGKA